MKLNNWSFALFGDPTWMAPEMMSPRLHGIVEGHPRMQDGTEVTTSEIVGKSGECVVTHSGGLYELGYVDPNYEREFPDARNRLFNALKEVPVPNENEHRNRHAEYAAKNR